MKNCQVCNICLCRRSARRPRCNFGYPIPKGVDLSVSFTEEEYDIRFLSIVVLGSETIELADEISKDKII